MWKDDDHIYASPGTKQAFSAEKSEQLRNIAFSVMVLILHTFSEKKKRATLSLSQGRARKQPASFNQPSPAPS